MRPPKGTATWYVHNDKNWQGCYYVVQPCTLSGNKRTGAWSGALLKQLGIQGRCTTFQLTPLRLIFLHAVTHACCKQSAASYIDTFSATVASIWLDQGMQRPQLMPNTSAPSSTARPRNILTCASMTSQVPSGQSGQCRRTRPCSNKASATLLPRHGVGQHMNKMNMWQHLLGQGQTALLRRPNNSNPGTCHRQARAPHQPGQWGPFIASPLPVFQELMWFQKSSCLTLVVVNMSSPVMSKQQSSACTSFGHWSF